MKYEPFWSLRFELRCVQTMRQHQIWRFGIDLGLIFNYHCKRHSCLNDTIVNLWYPFWTSILPLLLTLGLNRPLILFQWIIHFCRTIRKKTNLGIKSFYTFTERIIVVLSINYVHYLHKTQNELDITKLFHL